MSDRGKIIVCMICEEVCRFFIFYKERGKIYGKT